MFEEFINYHNSKDPKDISEKAVLEFLRYLVMERKVSTSYQNQSVNAIKYYYEKVLGGSRKFYFVERPKTEKTLPVVLNIGEVSQLIKVTENLKHKCMLMLAYSGGLRLRSCQQISYPFRLVLFTFNFVIKTLNKRSYSQILCLVNSKSNIAYSAQLIP